MLTASGSLVAKDFEPILPCYSCVQFLFWEGGTPNYTKFVYSSSQTIKDGYPKQNLKLALEEVYKDEQPAVAKGSVRAAPPRALRWWWVRPPVIPSLPGTSRALGTLRSDSGAPFILSSPITPQIPPPSRRMDFHRGLSAGCQLGRGGRSTDAESAGRTGRGQSTCRKYV